MVASSAQIDAFLQAELRRRRLEDVPAVEAARWLHEAAILTDSNDRPGLPLRNLLRAGLISSAEQRPPSRYGRWYIVRRRSGTAARVDSLGIPDGESSTAAALSGAKPAPQGTVLPPRRPVAVGHRVTINWMGTEIETLDDLLRPALRVICIGVNPAPTSVAIGHYYQGSAGRLFLSRLRAVGLLPPHDDRWEDDVAFELGIGQTDVVKRPTSKAEQVHAAEFQYGKHALETRLTTVCADLVLFTFKKAATVVFGDFIGHGFVPGLTLCGGRVFVMPGPYEKTEVARESISVLAGWVKRHMS